MQTKGKLKNTVIMHDGHYLHYFAFNIAQVEAILSKSRYLTGNAITEADVRLFTTLVRFDMVYVGHFKV